MPVPRHPALAASLAASLAALALLGPVPRSAPAAAPRLPGPHHVTGPHGETLESTSTNWSGYAATGGGFTSVSAGWTQPTATCTSTDSSASFWVGLDGDTSNTVEQTGTAVDCSGGTPVYYAWLEMYPGPLMVYPSPVAPGDQLQASVRSQGGGYFRLTLTDSTQGWTQSATRRLRSAKRASAEVIAEAPTGQGGVLPLTDFGTVPFTAATVNGQPIGGFGPDNITMASGSTVKATTSALRQGTDFSVTWQHS